jgi:seryl-tRNA synthetase
MHDIKAIRDDPAAFDAGLAARGLEPQAAALLKLDEELRKTVTAKQDAETRRNAASKEIGQAKAKGDDTKFEVLRGEVAQLKVEMEALGPVEDRLRKALTDALAVVPNLPAADVPEGTSADDNVEKKTWGKPRTFDFKIKDHVDVGEGLGGLDFERAAAMSGARFAILKGGLARMERALAQLMLDLHTEQHGYREMSPPYLVRPEAMFGTGQLPKFRQDLFVAQLIDWDQAFEFFHKIRSRTESDTRIQWPQLAAEVASEFDDPVVRDWALAGLHEGLQERHGETAIRGFKWVLGAGGFSEDRYLIPTAEVPLTNLVREQIVDPSALPMRLTAWTPCFRAEAGAAGKDTRGLIRMHQFHKVELVSITTPEQSDEEHERMTECAEKVLELLELPYRRMLLCTGDMGFAARKTYDLEVWLPSQDTYREISSCSNCGDFQARRMDARFKREGAQKKGSGKPEHVHTLNGSGVAVGRALVAVLENHQNADGSVTVPKALRPYMRAMERLEPAQT